MLVALYWASGHPVARRAIVAAVSEALKPELVLQTGHTGGIDAVVFSPDKRLVVTSGFDYSIKLWSVATGDELRSFSGMDSPPQFIGFTPDGRKLMTSGPGWTGNNAAAYIIRFWDVTTGRELVSYCKSERRKEVRGDQRGRQVAGVRRQGRQELWFGIWKRTRRNTWTGHSGNVLSVAFSPNGSGSLRRQRTRPSKSGTSRAERYSTMLRDTPTKFEAWRSAPTAACWKPGRRRGGTALPRSNFRKRTGGAARKPPRSGCAEIERRRPNAGWFEDEDKSIRLIDTSTGNEIGRLPGNFKVDEIVAFTATGNCWQRRRVTTQCDYGMWKPATNWWRLRGIRICWFRKRSVPDGHWLASGSDDHTIKLVGPGHGKKPAGVGGTHAITWNP